VHRSLSPLLAAVASLPAERPFSISREAARAATSRIAKWNRLFSARLRECGYGRLERQALSRLTLGAALKCLLEGRGIDVFLEQVQYNGRRLAKLELPPVEILRVLREYDAISLPVLAPVVPEQIQTELRLTIALAVNDAYYQVRASEAETFFALSRAEMANDIGDLTAGFIAALSKAFPAKSCTVEWSGRQGLSSARCRRFNSGSCWQIPIRIGGEVQGVLRLEYPGAYEWLPRERALLEAACDRFGSAVQRLRLIEDLAQREREVRRLASHMLQVEEKERRRIGRELHDEAGQSLLFLRLQLEQLETSLPDKHLRARAGQLREVAERTIAEVRRLIGALGPAVLEQMGLPAAIRQLAARLSSMNGLRVRLHVQERELSIPQESQIVLYRVLQESITNVLKHAEATVLKISLRATDRWIELEVADNGAGFDTTSGMQKAGAFGLSGMTERVSLIGGELRVESRPHRGSRIWAKVPG
jgi:signal transduction histidine kinase